MHTEPMSDSSLLSLSLCWVGYDGWGTVGGRGYIRQVGLAWLHGRHKRVATYDRDTDSRSEHDSLLPL